MKTNFRPKILQEMSGPARILQETSEYGEMSDQPESDRFIYLKCKILARFLQIMSDMFNFCKGLPRNVKVPTGAEKNIQKIPLSAKLRNEEKLKLTQSYPS